MKLENINTEKLKEKRTNLYDKWRYHIDKGDAINRVLEEINHELTLRLIKSIKQKFA